MKSTRLLALLAVSAMLAPACGTDSAGDTTSTAMNTTTTTIAPETTTSSPSETTTTALAEPTPLRDVEGDTRSGLGWLAEPGLYVAYVDGRTLTLSMPEAFTYIPRPADLILAPANIPPGPRITSIAFTGLDGVIAVDQVGADVPDEDLSEATEPVPDLLSEWLDAVPQLSTTPLDQVAGQGWGAQVWDVVVDSSGGETFSCLFGACIESLVPKRAAPYVMGDEFSFRIWQLDGAGEGLFGFAQADLTELGAASDFYEMVLGGLTIEE